MCASAHPLTPDAFGTLVTEFPGLGLPLRTRATIWKGRRSLKVEDVLAGIEHELRKHGADPVRIEAGLHAQLPLVRWKPRRLAEWRQPFQFEEVHDIDVQVVETDRAFHLVVSGHTSVLVPILATLFAYAITAGLAHPAPFVSPLVGVTLGLTTWGLQWMRFHAGVQVTADRCAARLAAGGAYQAP